MRFKILNLIILYDFKIFRGANIKIYSLETKIHISLINSYAPQYIAFFLSAEQRHERSERRTHVNVNVEFSLQV